MLITPVSFSELKQNVISWSLGITISFLSKKFGYYGCKYKEELKEELKEEEGDCST